MKPRRPFTLVQGPAACWLLAFFISINLPAAETDSLPVGVAQVDITPDYDVRLSGFGSRRTESEGITQRIWAKALAFGDDDRGPAILIATDNLGVPDEITREVAKRLAERFPFQPVRLAITATHTHTAPMLKNVAPTLFGAPIPPAHQSNIDRYTREFTDRLEQVAVAAVQNIQPSRVVYGVGSATFTVNRRTPGGPVDHDLPVMVVKAEDGKTRAVYFSYACHCVTLSHNRISGDWAGYAMEHIQENHPGAIALASIGCGADANPRSGVTGGQIEVADEQGRQIADAVQRVLQEPLTEVTESPHARLVRLELPFAPPRSQAEWEERSRRDDAVGYHARVNLERLARGETLPVGIEYPVQTWTFGDTLAMVFLPGEVVVDYSLRLKREFDRQRLWINAYANDAPCYIPSERVLREGGYEGGDAMIYYDQPQIFAPGLEQKIIDAVRELTPESFQAPPGTEGTAPRSPDQSRAALRAKPGLVVETVATEPLIQSPVAIDWDASGHLWVCEMFDYPTGLDGQWKPGGRIKRLRDTNGDGLPDVADLFLDDLPFPTGLMAWGRGVLVCAAPNILYGQDDDDDGRADRVETLFSGFAAENYQARVNSLSLGLDHWIYGANGLLGGVITSDHGEVDIRGHDFRFRWPGEDLQTVNGLTQQGRVRDDWGRWFGCDNGSALHFFPHEARYFRRNPTMSPPPAALIPPGDFDIGRVFPLSRALERFNDPEAINRITSGCGLGIYRDTLLGEEYYHNTFTCEPVHNLVHRLVLEQDGSDLRRRRANDEQESEFLASTDLWFRPVQARTGPDGALYVVDMYRFLIEHPRWINAERLAQIDVRAGATKGRIYRVKPAERPLRPVRDLTGMNPVRLAKALDTPNGTERDRVHVEILSRRRDVSIEGLRRLATTAAWPPTRIQALSVLQALDGLNMPTLLGGLADEHERLQAWAVRLAEPRLREAHPPEPLVASLSKLADTPSSSVARQLAFTLGEWNDPRAGDVLVKLAARWFAQPDVRWAVLSSARRHVDKLLAFVLNDGQPLAQADHWLPPLLATAAASEDRAFLVRTWESLLPEQVMTATPHRLNALAGLLDACEDRELDLVEILESSSPSSLATQRWQSILTLAFRLADDDLTPPEWRAAAVSLLARRKLSDEVSALLCRLAARSGDESVRTAARAGLRKQATAHVASCLLDDWPHIVPRTRREIVNLLMERDIWTVRLLKSIRNGIVSPQEIAMTDRQRLRQSRNENVLELARSLWGDDTPSDRAPILIRYAAALTLEGDASRGAGVFSQNCASCHAWAGAGHEVGPDLAALRTKDASYWLKNILDPNAVVEPRYVAYEIETKNGRSLSGIIQTETSAELTLVSGQGQREVVSHDSIREIRASRFSLMPEGLEQAIPLQSMADLLAYLRASISP